MLAAVSGTQQLIVFGGDTLYGMDPATGKTIWSEPWATNYEVNAATPVYSGGHLFVTSEYGQGCMMLRVTPGGVQRLWEKKDIQSKFQGVVLDAGLLYGTNRGTLVCLGWPDGDAKWKTRRARRPWATTARSCALEINC